MEQDPFVVWDEQFSDSAHQLEVAEGVIDLAKMLLPDILRAPQAQRKEKSNDATRILEEAYPLEFLSSNLALVAGRALVIESLLWDEYVAECKIVDGPIHTMGRLAGFRFVHHQLEHINDPVPIFGLKLVDSRILGVDEVPVAAFRRPLLIPVEEIRDLPTA